MLTKLIIEAECIFMSRCMENNQIRIILDDLIFVKEKNNKRNVKQ